MCVIGRPRKPVEEKRTIFSVRVDPVWLSKFREWSKLQHDSQGMQVEAGINLLMQDRKQ